jgi:chemotaxis-related protein WspD
MDDQRESPQDATRAHVDDCWNKIGVRGDGSCPELARYVHCRNCPVYFAGAVAMLDRPPPSDYLAEWTNHFAEPKQAQESETHSAVIFRIGAEWLALPTQVVSEVTNALTIHSLPHRRSGVVIGLANVRGELVVCASLAHALGVGPAAAAKQNKLRSQQARLLVIRREDVRMVCPVDEVHGTHRFQSRELQEVPSTIVKAAASYSKAILSWDKHSVGLLDEDRLFSMLKRSIA